MKFYRNTRIFVVLLGLMFASASQAQLELVAGYLINNEISKSQQKEYSAGKIVCNVYLQTRSGQLLQLPGWDPSTMIATSWPDDVVLEPVLFINSSKSPYEVQWAISTSEGPLMKQAYMKVDGGRRGKDGTADDNGGYRQKSPMFRVGDMPKGWFAISASWGKGQSATIQAQRYGVDEFIQMTENPEVLKALALTNGAPTPSIPVFTGRMPDGSIRQATSVEELEVIAASSQTQNQTSNSQELSGIGGQGFEVQRSEPEIDPVPVNATNLRVHVYRYNDKDRRRGDAGEVMRHLASKAGQQQPLPFDANTIPIPTNGDGIAILIFSTEEIAVEFRGDSGRKVYDISSTDYQGGKLYSCLVTLTLKRGEKPAGKLLVTEGDTTTIYGFKETH